MAWPAQSLQFSIITLKRTRLLCKYCCCGNHPLKLHLECHLWSEDWIIVDRGPLGSVTAALRVRVEVHSPGAGPFLVSWRERENNRCRAAEVTREKGSKTLSYVRG